MCIRDRPYTGIGCLVDNSHPSPTHYIEDVVFAQFLGYICWHLDLLRTGS